MRNELLLPCPFCGGEARMHASHHGDTHYYQVECGNDYDCGAWPAVRVCHSEAEAIKAWNTRAERTCKNVGELADFCCSECGARLYTETTYGYTMIERDEETIIKMPRYCPSCGAKVVD